MTLCMVCRLLGAPVHDESGFLVKADVLILPPKVLSLQIAGCVFWDHAAQDFLSVDSGRSQ